MSQLEESLAEAAAEAFTWLRETYPDERFYFFALYTVPEDSYVCATAWSEEALTKVVARYKQNDERRSEAELTRSLRFSAPDSPYHKARSEKFAQLDGARDLHDACFHALQLLDRKGLFGVGAVRERVILNVVYGDMSDEQWLAHAQRLNPREAVDAAIPFLRLHSPSGRVSAWGAGGYQVTALSLSADRSVVAYSGSGGEVGVLRVRNRAAIFEKTRRDKHWASVLSPNGACLYLGGARGVSVLDCRTGKTKPLTLTTKPHCIAVSPDGKQLAVSSWESPFSVFDLSSGKPIWTSPKLTAARVAFSPCGTRLAAAVSAHDKEQWACSASCFDASSGRELWIAPLGAGRDASIAWAPNGELLAAASEWVYSPDGECSGAASLSFFSSEDGEPHQVVPWGSGIDALAIAPSGTRIAMCSGKFVVVVNRAGEELARGTGGQESMIECVFVDDDTVIATGRNVNGGPALLSLSI